jgi:thioesterase domain-containing protein
MAPDSTPAEWRARLASLWAGGIPLAGAMQVEIRALDHGKLVLAAPLAPNRNQMGSAFGGSLQGIAMLAGWGATLIAAGADGARHVVVRSAQMRFLAPVSGELVATAVIPSAGAAAAFRIALAEKGRARLTVPVAIQGPGGDIAARYVGEYVAFGPDP